VVVVLAVCGCYNPPATPSCAVRCEFGSNEACPAEQTCQQDNLCHAGSDTCGSLSPYVMAVLADQPIAYWRLDEAPGATVAHDFMNHAYGMYEGTCTNGVAGALSSDTAVRFDGATCLIRIPSNALFQFVGNKPFTIEAWVSRDDSPVFRHVFTRETRDTAPVNGYAMLLDNGSMGYGERAVNHVTLGTVPALVSSGFQHVATTYDGTMVAFYAGGIPFGMVPATDSMPAVDVDQFIGAASATENWFSGVIDEVAVYDKALTIAQLQAHIAARD
jgi:hypothetical protein